MISVARFAREVAAASLEHGVIVRGAICTGGGAVFEDAGGQANLASPSHARATDLLKRLQAGPPCPALAIEAVPAALLDRIQQRLPGWKLETGGEENAPAIWRMGDFPPILPTS